MVVETQERLKESVKSFKGWTSTPFNIPEHFKNKFIPSKKETNAVPNRAKTNEISFKMIKQAVISHFKQTRENNTRDEEQTRWIELKHGAVVGNKAAVEWFKREIEDILIRSNWLHVPFPFPKQYGNIVEAVYQETYGIGPVSTWWKHPRYAESEAASIIGTRIFFEFPGDDENDLQEVSYESVEDVIRVATQLSLRSATGVLNPHHPTLEIDMEDGTRVTISIPPDSVEPLITFRHFTIDRPSISVLADKGTYPAEIIPVMDAIAAGRLTTVFAGPVKSGKTTLMEAFIARRKAKDNILIFHKGFDEMRVHQKLPNHKIKQYIITDENRDRLFPTALRSDYEYLVVAELRSIEAELFLKSAERGKPGAMTTFHNMEPKNIPSLIADLVIEDYPSKSYDTLYKRIAESVHVTFVLEEMNDKSKRLNQITLFNFDGESLTTHDLMRWDEDLGTWVYSQFIPERLLKIMMKYAPTETKRGLDVLKQLVKRQGG